MPRRNILREQALKYYRFIAATVEIPASESRERFDITNQTDGKVAVSISKVKRAAKLNG